MTGPTVSIAMATFNGERYLREQLDSLAAQTRLPDELVICDDGSTDGTLKIAGEFAALAPFAVRIERNADRLGYAKNFERAASLCKGDIIFFCDQDDVWFPEKIAEIARRFDDDHIEVVINDAELVDGDKRPFGYTQLDALLRLGFHRFDFDVGCFSAHRRSWQSVAFPVPNWIIGHDHWTNRLAHACGLAQIIETPLQLYRRHGANTSQWAISNKGASNLQMIRDHGLANVSDQWRFHTRIMQHMKQRLGDVAPGHPREEALLQGQAFLRQRIRAAIERDQICRRPRLRRAPLVAGFWLRGGYRFNRRWLSAAKDLIRP